VRSSRPSEVTIRSHGSALPLKQSRAHNLKSRASLDAFRWAASYRPTFYQRYSPKKSFCFSAAVTGGIALRVDPRNL
jgi:hypothetical protein